MKYAITGLRGRINRILETANDRTVEITDEQGTAALALIEARRPAILFDGRVTNPQLERAAGSIMRWNEEAEAWSITPYVPPVPSPITAWQAIAALKLTPHPQDGTLFLAADAAIDAMPDSSEKIVVQTAWERNANFERNSPTILSFGTALGMTSDDLDNLFRLGGSLTV